MAVLIGAVGSISVVVVPKALADFDSKSLRNATFGLVLAASVYGLLALLAAVQVAQGWPKIDPEMDAAQYRQQTIDSAARGVTSLQFSRALTVIALMCILTASVLSQIDTITAPASGVNVLVVHRDGTTTCGPVTDATSAKDVVSTTVVANC